jgi:integrase
VKTMNNYAQWLANFLEWAELRGIDIFSCDYATHVAGRYQKEMLEGLWSRTGQGLSATTVNVRVQQACDFLTWLTDKGNRPSFEVPYDIKTVKVGSAVSSIGHLDKIVRVRKGKVRPTKASLRMPADDEVRQWLARVNKRFGATQLLMCETVLLTAMRREEVVSLRLDTLPERREDWHIANPLAPAEQQQVRVNLRYGTKGPSYGTDHGDKIGPSRDILIPLTLALRWHEYRRTARNQAFAKWVKDAKGTARLARAKQSVHLFLRESDGARFKGTELYSAWTGVTPPIDGWSPHQGRHWWACSILWRELKKHQGIASLSHETATALLESTALSIIRLQIQPQLGHAQDSTTMIYLRWVMDMLAVPLSFDGEAEPEDDTEGEE